MLHRKDCFWKLWRWHHCGVELHQSRRNIESVHRTHEESLQSFCDGQCPSQWISWWDYQDLEHFGISISMQNGEPEAVYKTNGSVNNLRPGEGKTVYAIVSRNIFYEIDTGSNKIVKCIKFNKHSITSFFCYENQLVFGNIENKILIYDLNTYDPEAPEVPFHLVRNLSIRSWLKAWVVGCWLLSFATTISTQDAMTERSESTNGPKWKRSKSWAATMTASSHFPSQITCSIPAVMITPFVHGTSRKWCKGYQKGTRWASKTSNPRSTKCTTALCSRTRRRNCLQRRRNDPSIHRQINEPYSTYLISYHYLSSSRWLNLLIIMLSEFKTPKSRKQMESANKSSTGIILPGISKTIKHSET